MKTFFEAPAPINQARPETVTVTSYIHTRARVAVYDALSAAPRVEEVGPGAVGEYIEALATLVYQLAREQGGTIPYTVVREVTENFIHADFAEPVVSVLDNGHTIRFADQGPGILDSDRAVLPGYTTASGEMKRYIRGVGSGLPIVREHLAISGGSLVIEDNLGGNGSVVTLSEQAPTVRAHGRAAEPYEITEPVVVENSLLDFADHIALAPAVRLSTRQKQVLALVLESGLAGPSLVSRELRVGISTAYRDLASLEDMGLISSDSGKRTLTDAGLDYLGGLTNGQ